MESIPILIMNQFKNSRLFDKIDLIFEKCHIRAGLGILLSQPFSTGYTYSSLSLFYTEYIQVNKRTNNLLNSIRTKRDF